jgi:hypothetical protein
MMQTHYNFVRLASFDLNSQSNSSQKVDIYLQLSRWSLPISVYNKKIIDELQKSNSLNIHKNWIQAIMNNNEKL